MYFKNMITSIHRNIKINLNKKIKMHKTDLGRWKPYQYYDKNIREKVLNNKIDLANIDNCYCNDFKKCMSKN